MPTAENVLFTLDVQGSKAIAELNRMTAVTTKLHRQFNVLNQQFSALTSLSHEKSNRLTHLGTKIKGIGDAIKTITNADVNRISRLSTGIERLAAANAKLAAVPKTAVHAPALMPVSYTGGGTVVQNIRGARERTYTMGQIPHGGFVTSPELEAAGRSGGRGGGTGGGGGGARRGGRMGQALIPYAAAQVASGRGLTLGGMGGVSMMLSSFMGGVSSIPAMLGAGLAIGAGYRAIRGWRDANRQFREFEFSATRTGLLAGTGALGAQARGLGARTPLTPMEIGEGQQLFARAGLRAGSIMNLTPIAIQGALAMDVPMQDVAQFLTSQKYIYGLRDKQLKDVMDVATATTFMTNIDPQRLFKTASSLSPIFAQTQRLTGADQITRDPAEALVFSGLLGNILGQQNIRPRTIMTALQRAYTGEVKGARETMARLGLDFKGKTFTEIFTQLSEKAPELTRDPKTSTLEVNKEFTAYFTKLFGQRAGSALGSLVLAWQEMEPMFEKITAASKDMTALVEESLSGTMQRIKEEQKSSAQELSIAWGNMTSGLSWTWAKFFTGLNRGLAYVFRGFDTLEQQSIQDAAENVAEVNKRVIFDPVRTEGNREAHLQRQLRYSPLFRIYGEAISPLYGGNIAHILPDLQKGFEEEKFFLKHGITGKEKTEFFTKTHRNLPEGMREDMFDILQRLKRDREELTMKYAAQLGWNTYDKALADMQRETYTSRAEGNTIRAFSESEAIAESMHQNYILNRYGFGTWLKQQNKMHYDQWMGGYLSENVLSEEIRKWNLSSKDKNQFTFTDFAGDVHKTVLTGKDKATSDKLLRLILSRPKYGRLTEEERKEYERTIGTLPPVEDEGTDAATTTRNLLNTIAIRGGRRPLQININMDKAVNIEEVNDIETDSEGMAELERALIDVTVAGITEGARQGVINNSANTVADTDGN